MKNKRVVTLENIENVTQDIIAHFGKEKQYIVAIEELSELTKVLTKILRGKDDLDSRKNLLEELADVQYMLDQIRMLNDISMSELDKITITKAQRTIDFVTKDKIEDLEKAQSGLSQEKKI